MREPTGWRDCVSAASTAALPCPATMGNDWGSSCHGYTDRGRVDPISSGLRWRGERYIPKNVFFLLEEILIYDAPESATSGGPDSLNRISTSISGTSAGIRLPHGPRASDEADGNTGRSQPGFFRITGTKYFVPCRSQAKNISYPADHRKKIFRTLPQMAWGGEFFSSDIMWWLGDWTRLILHQLPLPRKSLKRGKDIFSRVRLFVHEAKRKVRIFSVSCRSAMNFVRESLFCGSHEKF